MWEPKNKAMSYPCTDPFYWAWLPLAKVPFSDDIAFLVLEKLKDDDFVQSLVEELRTVFKVSHMISDQSHALNQVM